MASSSALEPETLQALRAGFAARGRLPAIISFSGGRAESWSFAELAERAGRLAGGLAHAGIGRGGSVALIAPNSARWIAAFWGIAATGATAVPLDAQNSDAELARMLAVGDCRLAFTTAAVAQRLRSLAPGCGWVILDRDNDSEAGFGWDSFLAPQEKTVPPVATPSDIAVLVFTSGTTGSPKAVPLSHANLLTNVLALHRLRIVGPQDRALLPLPLYHAYPLTIGMLTPLALGCAVVLPAGISGPELLGALRDGGVTALVGVPRLYTGLADAVERGLAARSLIGAAFRMLLGFTRWSLRHGARWPGRLLLQPLRRRIAPKLRLLVSGGAAVKPEIEETLDALGWEMLTGYGLVETSSMLTFNPPGKAVIGSAGRPVPGTAIRIAQPDAEGVGEIEASGPSLFKGYRDDSAKTQEAFTPDGWFRTGDLGAIDARGYLHIAARRTETIVLADGKKLYPEEFEAAYATAPLVREIALLGVDGALVALIVPDLAAAREAGAERLSNALREGLSAKANGLPSHARLAGFAITHQPLPRTQLGKIRRHLLPALYEAAQRHKDEATSSALTAEDHALLAQPRAAALWRWLQQRFSDHALQLDTILQLDLGIDSLGWVELTLAMERDLGITLREQEIARIATIRDLLREAAAAPSTARVADLAVAARRWLAPLKPWHIILRAGCEPLIRLAMRSAFQLRVEGLERLPPADPILICPNHVSYLDPFALGMALPRHRLERTYWAGWTGIVFNTLPRRFFSRVARVIPIDPDRAVATGLGLGRLALERGWNLVWFPEGARSSTGQLLDFLPGIGILVETHAVPIVPAVIEGSFEAWPVGRRVPRLFAPITVRFGEPILPALLPSDLPGRNRDEKIALVVHAAVAALAQTAASKRGG